MDVEKVGESNNGRQPDSNEEPGSPERDSPTENNNRGARMLRRIKARLLFSGDGITAPNWPIIGLMFLSLFASAFTLTFLFPFLPEMIVGFGYTEEQKGYYAGLVASSVFAGRATGSFFWGWLSDRKGRKLVLILTLGGSGIFSLMFGFTRNLGMAIAARFFTGLFSGILGTAKTVLYEVSDDTNQAVGMSMISLAWGGGIILGPATGGYLASPGKKYASFSSIGFFNDFPYILPAIVTFFVNVIALVVIAFKLPETLYASYMTVTVPSEMKALNRDDDSDTCCCKEEERRSKSCGDLNTYSCARTAPLGDAFNSTSASDDASQNIRKISNPSPLQTDITDTAISTAQNTKDKNESWNGVTNGSPVSNCGESRSKVTECEQCQSKKTNCEKSVTSYSNGNSYCSEETNCSYRLISEHHFSVPNLRTSGRNTGYQRICSCGSVSGRKDGSRSISCYEQPKVKDTDYASSDTSLKKRGLWNAIVSSSLVKYMRQSDVRQSVTLFTVFSFAIIGFDDVFTLWASTDSRLDGLGFSTDMIGTVLSIVGVPLLLLLIFIFSTLVKHFGIKKTYMICAFILTIAVTVCPTLHMITDRSEMLLPLLLMILVPVRLCASCCFSATALFINNSVSPEHAGAVNGIGMTFTAIARTLAPAIGGSIFAWTVGHGADIGAPFDVSLIFFLFGFVFWATVVMCVFVPERLNKQKKR